MQAIFNFYSLNFLLLFLIPLSSNIFPLQFPLPPLPQIHASIPLQKRTANFSTQFVCPSENLFLLSPTEERGPVNVTIIPKAKITGHSQHFYLISKRGVEQHFLVTHGGKHLSSYQLSVSSSVIVFPPLKAWEKGMRRRLNFIFMCLPHKHGDLSLGLQHPGKSWGWRQASELQH